MQPASGVAQNIEVALDAHGFRGCGVAHDAHVRARDAFMHLRMGIQPQFQGACDDGVGQSVRVFQCAAQQLNAVERGIV